MANKSGTISVAETWNDTDLVIGDVTIDGVQVDLDAGATFFFDSNITAALKITCINGGTFKSNATSGNRSRFTGNKGTQAAGDWDTIDLTADGNSDLSFIDIEFGTTGITTTKSTQTLTGLEIDNCTKGCIATTGLKGTTADHIKFTNSATAITIDNDDVAADLDFIDVTDGLIDMTSVDIDPIRAGKITLTNIILTDSQIKLDHLETGGPGGEGLEIDGLVSTGDIGGAENAVIRATCVRSCPVDIKNVTMSGAGSGFRNIRLDPATITIIQTATVENFDIRDGSEGISIGTPLNDISSYIIRDGSIDGTAGRAIVITNQSVITIGTASQAVRLGTIEPNFQNIIIEDEGELVTIENCIIVAGTDATASIGQIQLLSGAGARGLVVKGCDFNGTVPTANQRAISWLLTLTSAWASNNITISDCTFNLEGGAEGVRIDMSAANQNQTIDISGCTFLLHESADIGIEINNSSTKTITFTTLGSSFSDPVDRACGSKRGTGILYARTVTATDDTLAINNSSFRGLVQGIHFASATNFIAATITECAFIENQKGILIVKATSVTVIRCTFTSNCDFDVDNNDGALTVLFQETKITAATIDGLSNITSVPFEERDPLSVIIGTTSFFVMKGASSSQQVSTAARFNGTIKNLDLAIDPSTIEGKIMEVRISGIRVFKGYLENINDTRVKHNFHTIKLSAMGPLSRFRIIAVPFQTRYNYEDSDTDVLNVVAATATMDPDVKTLKAPMRMKITATDFTGASKNVTITGTSLGITVNEVIAVTANGTFTGLKRFDVLDTNGITITGLPSFTIQVEQVNIITDMVKDIVDLVSGIWTLGIWYDTTSIETSTVTVAVDARDRYAIDMIKIAQGRADFGEALHYFVDQNMKFHFRTSATSTKTIVTGDALDGSSNKRVLEDIRNRIIVVYDSGTKREVVEDLTLIAANGRRDFVHQEPDVTTAAEAISRGTSLLKRKKEVRDTPNIPMLLDPTFELWTSPSIVIADLNINTTTKAITKITHTTFVNANGRTILTVSRPPLKLSSFVNVIGAQSSPETI